MNKKEILEQLRECAVRSKNYTLGMIGNIAGTVADALDEIDNAKAEKTAAKAVTIPTTGWQGDSTASYPKYYDISAAGVTAKDRAEITIAYSSLDTAKTCGLCPTNETLAGKIRVRAVSVPTKAISAEYWITDGKE